MSVKIVTGYTGSAHITSNDEQARNQGIFGRGNIILDVGSGLTVTNTSGMTLTVADGDGVMSGVHYRVTPGSVETLTVTPPAAGYTRIDAVIAKYERSQDTNEESVEIILRQGTATTGTPAKPSHVENDVVAGALTTEMVLAYVTVTSTAITNVANEIYASVRNPFPVGAIYMSVDGTIAPDVLFGGTWERIAGGRFLIGADSTYQPGAIGGEATHTLTANEMPSHSHTVTVDGQNPGAFTFTPGSTQQVINLGLKAYTTDSKGGGQAHNNMPPYLAVYMWKRTA